MASAIKLRPAKEASDKSESNNSTWPGPRKVTLQRNAAGFGFTLRHFIVYPPESAIAELSRQEGVASGGDRNKKRPKIAALEPMDTIFVKHVKPEGAAESAGLSTGDRIVSVNGESVTGKTYAQVVGLIQASDSCLKLLVVPREEDILQVAYPSSAYKSADEGSSSSSSQTYQPDVDSKGGSRAGSQEPGYEPGPAAYPSPILPSGARPDEAHDTVILHPESDLLSRQPRHTSEMVLAVGAKPIKASTPIYDGWTSSSSLSSRDAVDARSTPTGSHADTGGRTGYQPKPSTDATRYGYAHSRPTSGISVASSTSSADSSSTAGQKTGRTFKITSIFGSQGRTQSLRGEPSRLDAVGLRGHSSERQPSEGVSNRNIVHQKTHSLDQGPVVRLRTGTGPNDYITLTGQRRVDGIARAAPRQSNSMDNLAYGSEAQIEVRGNGGNQVSSSYDNLHLSGANGTEWEVRSGEQAMGPLENQKLGSDSQVNRSETVTRRYYKSKQVETSTVTKDRSASEVQAYQEVAADPRMRDLFMRQARHQRDRRGYEKKEAALSSSKSADSIRYMDGRQARSNTMSAGETRPPVSPTERRYSQFPDRNIQVGYPNDPRDAKNYGSSSNNGRRHHPDDAPFHRTASPLNTVTIIDRDGNALTTNLNEGQDGGPHSNHGDDTTEEEPTSPTRIQDRINYWHKKALDSSSDTPDGGSWRRGHSPDNHNPNGRYYTTAHVPLPGGGRDKPPVPKRDSSRGRVRERNMERERQHERKVYERHRSKSYDRSAQRSAAWFRTGRRQATDDMSVDSFTSDGAISLASSRKESTASSISDGCSLDDDYPPGSRQRLVRRTSYLRATLSDEEEGGGAKDASSVADTTSLSSMSAHGGDSISPVVMRRNATPRRNPSINKLKHIFGEGTPVIVEAIHKPGASTKGGATTVVGGAAGPSSTTAPGAKDQEVTQEGPANIKVELKEWKRASDRSWKPIWMVLKTKTIYLLKERREPSANPAASDDNHISIKASMVDIAYDYTKKKNVFRLSTSTGSEYLIQVSDTKTMLAWITSIQANLTPGGDDILSADIIMRKTQQHESTGGAPTTPGSKSVLSPPSNRKKGSRSPSPALALALAGPQPQAKKPSTGLAGKMRHKMKKKGSSSSGSTGTWGQPTPEDLKSLTFGVPLERCTPSETNEFVPMFVEICCNIVEDIGVESVGIYRVPGNTAAVSFLQDDLKDGPEDANLTDSRWRDVNVVSSLLKMFFRKLPNPMVPRDQYKEFIAANRCKDPAERMWALRRQIHNLPDHHYETMKCLAEHLRLVSQHSEINKMEVRNLAIVFGPTLIRSGDNSMVTMVTDMSDQCCIIESLIQHCEWFFSDDVESQQAVPSDAIPETELISSDASELLSKARKDDQSGESGSDSSKGKEINAKDLMSSVISAANRKLKGRASKKLPHSPEESDGSEFGFGRKGSDAEAKVRAIRNQASDTKATTEDEGEVCGQRPGRQRTTVRVNLRRDSQSSVETHESGTSVGAEPMTYAAARQQLHQQRGIYNPPRGRAATSDSRASASQGAAAGPLKPRKAATLAPDKDWRAEYARERERIEREHRQALHDYEKEEATNVEELYRPRDYLREISAVSSKIADFASREEDSSLGAVRRARHTADSDSPASDFSGGTTSSSSNNNNTLQAARSDPAVFSTRLEIRESASESESDFVQAMRAQFDERLQMVLQQENEEDRLSDKSSASSKAARNAAAIAHENRRTVDGVYSATPYQRTDEQEPYRVRTGSGTFIRNLRQIPHRTPTGSTANGPQPVSLSSRYNELSVASSSYDVDAKKKSKSTPNSTSSSPTRSVRPQRKTSRFEVTLTLEKKGNTTTENLSARGGCTTAAANQATTSKPTTTKPTTTTKEKQESSAYRKVKGGAKDTSSIKEQHRESRRRRHTVGGGRDAPEYRKILEHNLAQAGETQSRKASAFDRLRPFGRPARDTSPQTMKSWMDSERVRTNSSPNLLASVATSAPAPAQTMPSSTQPAKAKTAPGNAQPAKAKTAPGNAQPAKAKAAPGNAQPAKAKAAPSQDGRKLSLPTRKDGTPQKFSYV